MSSRSEGERPDGRWGEESDERSEGWVDGAGRDVGRPGRPGEPARGRAEVRLTRLMQEFQRRQRERPDLVVRPWWTASEGMAGADRTPTGFVVEYCPRGVDSAEIALRRDRVRVEGPGGLREMPLDLTRSWQLAGEEVSCPELMVNHLLAVADRLLGEAA